MFPTLSSGLRRAASTLTGGAVALAALALPSTAEADGCLPLFLTFDEPFYDPDELFTLEMYGAPGTVSVLLIDIAPGPFEIPGLGTLGVGLSPALIVAPLPNMPDSGYMELTYKFACGAPRLGVPFYFQAISFVFDPFAACLSNTATLLVVKNDELCSGADGCTPGYWKQSQHFDSWPAPYTPETLFADVFADAFPGATLLDVLSLGGGGLNALGRHAVAALLSAASPAVENGLTAQDVIDDFNGTFLDPEGDIEELKDFFANKNEQFCPLN